MWWWLRPAQRSDGVACISQVFLFKYGGSLSPFPGSSNFTRLPQLLQQHEQRLSQFICQLPQVLQMHFSRSHGSVHLQVFKADLLLQWVVLYSPYVEKNSKKTLISIFCSSHPNQYLSWASSVESHAEVFRLLTIGSDSQDHVLSQVTPLWCAGWYIRWLMRLTEASELLFSRKIMHLQPN